MHKAKACILACMDFRFQDKLQSWLKEHKYLGQCDEVIVAGASRDLVRPLKKFHKESLLRQIELSVKLHDPDEILIIDHQDCGGYAQDDTIPSGLEKNKDIEIHKKFAHEAKKVLEKKFPNKKIINIYIPFEGNIIEI